MYNDVRVGVHQNTKLVIVKMARKANIFMAKNMQS